MFGCWNGSSHNAEKVLKHKLGRNILYRVLRESSSIVFFRRSKEIVLLKALMAYFKLNIGYLFSKAIC